MREIKFRAWDPVSQEFQMEVDFSKNPMYWWEDMRGDYIYLQYTGLKDKNGVEIYDGDILSNPELAVVEFSRGRFQPRYGGGNAEEVEDDFYMFANSVSVVGNIYENQELLNNK